MGFHVLFRYCQGHNTGGDMNSELLQLIRETGYLSDATLTDQARYDLLTLPFWRRARALGYDLPDLRRKLWRAAGRPETFLLSQLPQ